MNLQAGKSYIMGNGDTVGPMIDRGAFFTVSLPVNEYAGVWGRNGQARFFPFEKKRNEKFNIVDEAG